MAERGQAQGAVDVLIYRCVTSFRLSLETRRKLLTEALRTDTHSREVVREQVAFVLVDWLSPLGPVVNALLAAVVAYLTILVGQRVLGRRICSDARLRRTGGRNGTAPRPRPKAGMSTWRAEPYKEKQQCETKAA